MKDIITITQTDPFAIIVMHDVMNVMGDYPKYPIVLGYKPRYTEFATEEDRQKFISSVQCLQNMAYKYIDLLADTQKKSTPFWINDEDKLRIQRTVDTLLETRMQVKVVIDYPFKSNLSESICEQLEVFFHLASKNWRGITKVTDKEHSSILKKKGRKRILDIGDLLRRNADYFSISNKRSCQTHGWVDSIIPNVGVYWQLINIPMELFMIPAMKKKEFFIEFRVAKLLKSCDVLSHDLERIDSGSTRTELDFDLFAHDVRTLQLSSYSFTNGNHMIIDSAVTSEKLKDDSISSIGYGISHQNVRAPDTLNFINIAQSLASMSWRDEEEFRYVLDSEPPSTRDDRYAVRRDMLPPTFTDEEDD